MSDEDGIHMHVTAKGKILFVCRKDGDSVSFQADLNSARELRDSLNSTVSQLEQDATVEA